MAVRIHDLGGLIARSYVVETPQGFIAVDTGFPGGEENFIERFTKIAPLSELNTIFLTHAHDDHAGFLQALLEKTAAKVVLHPAGVGALRAGESNDPPGAGYSSRSAWLFSLIKKEFRFPPVELGERAVFVSSPDEQVFLDRGLPLRILFLPGHTPDSIGLLLEDTGELFCGDAAMYTPISRARHTIWMEDAREFGRSWDVMLAYKPTKIVPTHGAPFSPRDLARYRHYMDNRALLPAAGKKTKP